MEKGDHIIEITKKGDNYWRCTLFMYLDNSGKYKEHKGSVNTSNFQELMIEIGNKKWIDLINKN